MTQEQKARAYDEAIGRAKAMIKVAANQNEAIGFANTIFPELAESEDERIKKGLIKGLSAMRDIHKHQTFSDDAININDAIDWLERQGETSEIVNKKKIASDILRGAAINLITWIDYNAAEGNMCLSNMECKDIEDALVSGDWDKIYAYIKKKLEKQGEQKASYSTIIETGDGGINALVTRELPTDGCDDEQKPADMVEPKFHEGEWVIIKTNGNEYVEQIIRIEYFANGYPQYILSNGLWFGNGTEARLWSIQDAKDGDVLASQYNKPFIYNGNRNSFHVGSYCGISVEGRFNVATEKCCWTENVNIHPATKEQRDLLFQKMEESNYKWDAEKKELKKIVTPIFNIGDAIIKKKQLRY